MEGQCQRDWLTDNEKQLPIYKESVLYFVLLWTLNHSHRAQMRQRKRKKAKTAAATRAGFGVERKKNPGEAYFFCLFQAFYLSDFGSDLDT